MNFVVRAKIWLYEWRLANVRDELKTYRNQLMWLEQNSAVRAELLSHEADVADLRADFANRKFHSRAEKQESILILQMAEQGLARRRKRLHAPIGVVSPFAPGGMDYAQAQVANLEARESKLQSRLAMQRELCTA